MAKIIKLKKPPLDEAGRLKRVAATQGRTVTWFETFEPTEKTAIAALCDEAGVLVPDAAPRFAAIIAAYAERINVAKATDAQADEIAAAAPVVADAATDAPA